MVQPNILIVGGGIGGLSAALALQHFGFKVSVFEQAALLREFGAGLVITPNATHALAALGVRDRILTQASYPKVNWIRHYATGVVLEERPDAAYYRQRYGAEYFHIHRADMHGAFRDMLLENDPDCLHLAHQLECVKYSRESVEVTFKNGCTYQGDVLIGADGSASAVRAHVFGAGPAAYTGQVAFRALVPMSELPESQRVEPRRLYVGPGRMFLQYAIRADTVMNVVAIAQQPDWQGEGWSIPATIGELAGLYRDFAAPVGELIESIPAGNLFKWGLRDREPLENWVSGRVAMLGDAAHPMSPFLGQGAAMAIEDGFVLGRCFSLSTTIDEALSRYEAARKLRANGVQLASREQAQSLQGGAARQSEQLGPGKSAETRGLLDYNPVHVTV